MAINPTDLTGVAVDDARLLILVARGIAPCLDSLEGEPKASAIAVLLAVAKESKGRPARHLAGETFPAASRTYRDVQSDFSADHRLALGALCSGSASGERAGMPRGSFPKPSPTVARLWPEEY